MALNIFFTDDIRRAIESAYDALASVSAAGDVSAEYRQGWEDALRNIAVAFDVSLGRKEGERNNGGAR